MPSDLSRRVASGGRKIPHLHNNGKADRGRGTYTATIDTGATARFISKELADILAALGKITRIRRQVRLADGRCGRLDEQLEMEIDFGMSQLILPGVVDSLVLGWNFLTQDGTEIKCAGHEIIIPARNRHNG